MSAPGFQLRPVDMGGHRGWYAADGAGPPLVLLASPLALAATYRPTVLCLSRTHHIYTVQMPGSGRGSRLAGWGVAEYAGWAAGFLDRFGLEDVTLIGHSYTGAVALAVAARHPRRVGRLVVADSVGVARDSVPRVLVAQVKDFLVVELGLTLWAWHHVAFNAVFHTRNFARMVWDSLRSGAVADAGRVRVPALVAWGGLDHTTPPDRAATLARHLSGATVRVAPDGSHGWVIDRADEFAAAVERFTGVGQVVRTPTGWGRC
jgi:pimeloyl-ACP methyl ester carboxylesterase